MIRTQHNTRVGDTFLLSVWACALGVVLVNVIF
jgi:hypothetical protein